MPVNVRRLNHAVLFVRDAGRAAAFYEEAFGFEVVDRMGESAVFMRAAGTENHHDLGLFAVGPEAPRAPRGSTGLYHLAWEVSSMEDLAAARELLQRMGALTGQSDHGVSKSLYGRDPDGNEFEVMWAVPSSSWGDYAKRAVVMPLDLEGEVARWSTPEPATPA